MTTYPFMQVDAFTAQPLTGNACAVVFDADSLDNATRLAIARENNLSETAYVVQSSVADFGARFFTPAEELPLAGHPTIATVFALIDSGRLKLTGNLTTITLELKVGPIPIEIQAQAGQVSRIIMSQKKPQFMRSYDVQDVMSLNIPAYAILRAQSDFFNVHLFCLEGATSAGQTFARDFVLPPDLIEDPFTGSATGGMGAYLWHYGLIDTQTFIAEQGHWMGRPGLAYVEVVGSRDDIETVKVGGQAVTVLRGELTL